MEQRTASQPVSVPTGLLVRAAFAVALLATGTFLVVANLIHLAINLATRHPSQLSLWDAEVFLAGGILAGATAMALLLESLGRRRWRWLTILTLVVAAAVGLATQRLDNAGGVGYISAPALAFFFALPAVLFAIGGRIWSTDEVPTFIEDDVEESEDDAAHASLEPQAQPHRAA